MKDSPYSLLKSQYYLPLIVYFAAEFTLGFIFLLCFWKPHTWWVAKYDTN